MNISGPDIKQYLNSLQIETNSKFLIIKKELIILCDDLETDIGNVKFSIIGGDRGHNGLKSLTTAFAKNDFMKIKIGVGRPNSTNQEHVVKYVLDRIPEGIKLVYNNIRSI